MVKVSALSSGVTSGTAAAVKTPAASSAAEATTVVTTLQAEEGPGARRPRDENETVPSCQAEDHGRGYTTA